MQQRRWYDPNVPQTLAIAQILLYINGVFAFLYQVLAPRAGSSGVIRLLFIGAVAAYGFGAYGIANGRKLGWQLGVVAACSPFILRFIDTLIAFEFFSFGDRIAHVIGTGRFSGGILSTLFDVALVALLLHPMSRNHQKIWFT
jgi:hypothetical protein